MTQSPATTSGMAIPTPPAVQGGQDIVPTAFADGRFETLASALTEILKFHVFAGSLTLADLDRMADKGGKATVTTADVGDSKGVPDVMG